MLKLTTSLITQFLEPNIGVYQITGFTQNAAKEVKEAFMKMKKEHELQELF